MATVLPYNRAYDSWQNLPSIATPFTAQAMNTIEDGVENNRNYIIALEENFLSAVPTGETTLSLLQGMDADTERHFFTDVALADFPTGDNHVWYLEIYKTSSNNLAFSNIILRDKTDGKSYVGTAEQNEVTWVEVGSGEGNASYLELTQSQYDALTPEQKNDGTIYFITNPTPSSVPSTIMASNVLYNGGSTLDVDNVADAVDDLATRTENLADYEATAIASKPYLVGDLFLENNALKKATQPIAQGGNITGSNSEDTTVGKEISRINSNLSDRIKSFNFPFDQTVAPYDFGSLGDIPRDIVSPQTGLIIGVTFDTPMWIQMLPNCVYGTVSENFHYYLGCRNPAGSQARFNGNARVYYMLFEDM